MPTTNPKIPADASIQRLGESWTQTEDAELLRRLRAGQRQRAISEVMGRTKKGVKRRVARLRLAGLLAADCTLEPWRDEAAITTAFSPEPVAHLPTREPQDPGVKTAPLLTFPRRFSCTANGTQIEHTTRNVLTIRMEPRANWEQWFLLSSDRHWDHPRSDRAMQRRHLEQAKARRAFVLDFGDLFCAMQGRFDPRSAKGDVRPEHQVSNYLDALVATADDWFAPYAERILLIGEGNHESSVAKRLETHLTARLTERLNARLEEPRILAGGFAGWVRFLFSCQGSKQSSRLLAYHHGYGGDAPVTKGVIQTNRMSVYLPDAHYVVTGHTHNEWQFPIPRLRLSQAGVAYHDEQLHVKLPGYKEEFSDGYGGWHVERGGPPKPTGAVWLRFFYTQDRVMSEVHRAK